MIGSKKRGILTAAVAVLTTCAMMGAATTASASPEHPNSDVGYPVFQGSKDPVPATGVGVNPKSSYLAKIFAQDKADGAGKNTSHDFWFDKMLARTGTQPAAGADGKASASNTGGAYSYEGADGNNYMFTRGRAAFMKSYDASELGFGGDLAYWESISGKNAYTITLSQNGSRVSLIEQGASRKQTPSYWKGLYTGSGLSVTAVKYFTNNNSLVDDLTLHGTAGQKVTLTASSPYATTADGDELTGQTKVLNNLTTIYPRFSGNGFTVKDGKLESTVTLGSDGTARTKLQLGLLADELPDSTTEYDRLRNGDLKDPATAYTTHVTTYNKWWVDNIPFIETPEHNIDKSVFYRWWLARFNYLDANMPGNTFQFPTAVEGALGYNNAIVLTTCMFINDLKWLRNPEYSYGPWVSAGETAKSKQYVDNPGDPANWSNSYTQYITDAALQSYLVHGGPKQIAEAIGTYGSNDSEALIGSKNSTFNRNGNHLIDWDWASMTGNDADAVSFDQHPGEAMDRPESASVWANTTAAAEAYRLAGDSSNASRMDALADGIKSDLLKDLWNPSTKLIQSKFIGAHDGQWAKWKEINNYYPYAVGMMPKGNKDYNSALRLFADADQYPVFPFFTADQADKAEMIKETGNKGSNNFSIINSTQLFRIYAAAIRDYDANMNGYITNEQFKKLLYWNAFAHYQGGDNRYPDQNEFWNTGSSQNGGQIDYRSWIHHTQLGTTNWTLIEDVAGLTPRADGKIELNPIAIPGWNHFLVNNLSYHGKDLTIVWNNDGHYASAPRGYSVYVNGALVKTSLTLTHMVIDTTGSSALPQATSISYPSGSRIVSMFAKAGRLIDPTAKNQTDLASGATISTSYSAAGHPASAAKDGTTINEPFWGTDGSPHAKDSLVLTFPRMTTLDDVRLYFYQTSSSATVSGYSGPALYTLEYDSGDGNWKTIPQQARDPKVPTANYNNIQFPQISVKRIRATFTPAPGYGVGVKEIEAYDTGIAAPASTNQAPDIRVSASEPSSQGVSLTGEVRDDGLPSGTLTTKWSMVSGPASVAFASSTSPSTTATFTKDGIYVLRLTASDGELTSHRDITIQGIASDGLYNAALASNHDVAKLSASYTAGWNNLNAINDGEAYYSNSQNSQTWGTWSGDRPKSQWLEYDWKGEIPLTKVTIDFWHDQLGDNIGDGVPIPQSWYVEYWDDASGSWKQVHLKAGQSYGRSSSSTNTVLFDTVKTSKLRAVFNASTNGTTYGAVGVSEFGAYADDPTDIEAVDIPTTVGSNPKLPDTVSVAYPDGSRLNLPVDWDTVPNSRVASEGEAHVSGNVIGASKPATATIWVRSDITSAFINRIVDQTQKVRINSPAINLPATVTGIYNNGIRRSGLPVTWDAAAVKAINLKKMGSYAVTGTVRGVSDTTKAKLTVQVVDPDAPAPSSVDTTRLQEAVDAARPLADREKDYTADSWKPFVQALARAEQVLADPQATQEDIDAATQALTTAQKGLAAIKPTPVEPDNPNHPTNPVKPGKPDNPVRPSRPSATGKTTARNNAGRHHGPASARSGRVLSNTGSAVIAAVCAAALLFAVGSGLRLAFRRHGEHGPSHEREE